MYVHVVQQWQNSITTLIVIIGADCHPRSITTASAEDEDEENN
jgi:hypothetical protein